METTVNERIVPNTQRQSGIELFRIISMLLIVAHHYVVNSGVTAIAYQFPTSITSIFVFLFGAWGKTAINYFVLITGYYMCKSNITSKKFFKILLEVVFYKVIIHSIFLATGYMEFSWGVLVRMFFPFVLVSNNFMSCYMLFFLFIPFLNILINNISKRQHGLLVLCLLIIYSVLGNIPFFTVEFNYITWFCVLYLVASYIRFYPLKWEYNTKRCALIFAITFLCASLSVVACLFLGEIFEFRKVYYFISDSNKILAFATALTAFMFSKNLKIKSKLINMIAASSFGVYLIHANSELWLWNDVFKVASMYSSKWLVPHAILTVVIIYVMCTVIDYIRLHTVEKWFFKKTDKIFTAIDKKIMGTSNNKGSFNSK